MTAHNRFNHVDGTLENDKYYVVSNYVTEDIIRGRKEPIEFPLRWVWALFLSCVTGIVVLVPLVAVNITPSRFTGLPWWRTANVYHVTPGAFQDSNADGTGDLTGIIRRVGYLNTLGMNTLGLGPMFSSANHWEGRDYDVTDFKAVDERYGTLEDFDILIKAIHKQGHHVIMDLVPNHSSDQHPWFKESRSSQNNAYSDYYVWHSGTTVDGKRQPPNNWNSVHGGSMWTWDSGRGQYYLHQYSSKQPDLNFHNPKVQEEFKSILSFWMDHGVDGFRVMSADLLYESADLLSNETRSCRHDIKWHDYDYLNHDHTSHRRETHALLGQWRELIEENKIAKDKEIMFVVEVTNGDLSTWPEYYSSGADMPTTDALLEAVNSQCDGNCLYEHISSHFEAVPLGSIFAWRTGHANLPRAANRCGGEYIEVYNLLHVMLPGPMFLFAGEELGMRDARVKPTVGKTAEKVRGHMLWDSGQNAGFSGASETPYVAHRKHEIYNVQAQLKEPLSVLSSFQELLSLHDDPSLQWGWMDITLHNKNVFSFVRTAKGWAYKKYMIVVNVGKSTAVEDFTQVLSPRFKMKKAGKVAYSTKHTTSGVPMYSAGNVVNLEKLKLDPGVGLVISF